MANYCTCVRQLSGGFQSETSKNRCNNSPAQFRNHDQGTWSLKPTYSKEPSDQGRLPYQIYVAHIYKTSRISSHILQRRPYRIIRRGKVALMEHA